MRDRSKGLDHKSSLHLLRQASSQAFGQARVVLGSVPAVTCPGGLGPSHRPVDHHHLRLLAAWVCKAGGMQLLWLLVMSCGPSVWILMGCHGATVTWVQATAPKRPDRKAVWLLELEPPSTSMVIPHTSTRSVRRYPLLSRSLGMQPVAAPGTRLA